MVAEHRADDDAADEKGPDESTGADPHRRKPARGGDVVGAMLASGQMGGRVGRTEIFLEAHVRRPGGGNGQIGIYPVGSVGDGGGRGGIARSKGRSWR